MAVLFMDSLATYGSLADMSSNGWSVLDEPALTLLPTGGKEGQPCIQFYFDETVFENVDGNDSYGELVYPWSHSGVTTIVGFMFRLDSLGASTGTWSIMYFNGNSGRAYDNVQLTLDEDGKLWMEVRATGLKTGGIQLSIGLWYHFSIKVEIANSPDGSASLQINGGSVIDVSGVDTLYSIGTDSIIFGNSDDITFNTTGLGYSISDIYFQDDLGGSVDDHLSPDTRVNYIEPDADGATTDFTPSSGAVNYDMVDEVINHDYDTTRNVSDGTLTDKDTLSMAALPEPSRGEIYAIQAVVVAKKDDASARTIKLIQKGTAEGLGAAKTLTEEWAYYKEVFLLHPDTSTAWTKTQFAAGEFGYGNDT